MYTLERIAAEKPAQFLCEVNSVAELVKLLLPIMQRTFMTETSAEALTSAFESTGKFELSDGTYLRLHKN